MQFKTHPEWFQTVPFVQAIDAKFDVVKYFDEDLNEKIDEIDDNGCGNFWKLLGTYKGFQILENVEGHILVSQSDGPCYETHDGWARFCEIDSYYREAVAIADAQEFVDGFVMSQRNDDPEQDWNVLGRLQLTLPL